MIKKKNDGFVLVTQEHILPTNCMKANIQYVTNKSKCHLCGEKDEATIWPVAVAKFHKLITSSVMIKL